MVENIANQQPIMRTNNEKIAFILVDFNVIEFYASLSVMANILNALLLKTGHTSLPIKNPPYLHRS